LFYNGDIKSRLAKVRSEAFPFPGGEPLPAAQPFPASPSPVFRSGWRNGKRLTLIKLRPSGSSCHIAANGIHPEPAAGIRRKKGDVGPGTEITPPVCREGPATFAIFSILEGIHFSMSNK